MKKLYLLLSLIALIPLFLICSGCENKKNNSLIGTWKCIGFGNTSDKTFREAEPKECEKCYTITFLSDGTITGYTSTNEIGGEYQIKGESLDFLKIGGTKINELFDGRNYVEALDKVHRFEIVSKQLKLYYSDTDYLLFKNK